MRKIAIAWVACTGVAVAQPRPDTAPAEPVAAPAAAAPAAAAPAAAAPTEPAAASEDPALAPEALSTEVVEVTSRYRTATERLRESAEAVSVVDLTQARRQSADLGEVLARTSSVGVSRSGGLGSDARLWLAGATGDQVRIFLDGVPIELAGFSGGIADVPVNLIERVEIYRGVVPIRFAADALGGVINLVGAEPRDGAHAAVSYQLASFGTHRLAASASEGRARGLYSTAYAYFDRSANDYDVDVKVPNASGQEVEATVPRFHDGYMAYGGGGAIGWSGGGALERVAVRGFIGDHDKELQSDPSMSRPYGGAHSGGLSAGASVEARARYAAATGSLIAGYAWQRTELVDDDTCVYNWFGACVATRASAGEIESRPSDRSQWKHTAYALASGELKLGGGHSLHAAVTPTMTWVRGNERLDAPATLDTLNLPRSLISLTAGVDHQVDAWADRIENIAFAKLYVHAAASDQRMASGAIEHLSETKALGGGGDVVRVRILEQLWAKASYEYATRLPQDRELFGDGVQIADNLSLSPERSHNGNLGLVLDARDTATGTWSAELGGVARSISNLIRLSGSNLYQRYQNVASARALGLDGRVAWSAPGKWLHADLSGSYLDMRNTSDSGAFAAYRDDRIPNVPYLQAAAGARLERRGLFAKDDVATLGWTSRYVYGYYLSWESVGARDTKPRTPDQLVHAASLGYQLPMYDGTVGASLEVANLGDAQVFDLYGIQRPGRAVFMKLVVER